MNENSVTTIDISEIPVELGKTLEERVKAWLALIDKGIRLVDKSKKDKIGTYYCYCGCLTCPYRYDNSKWQYNYSITGDNSNKTYCCSDSITTCTYNKNEA